MTRRSTFRRDARRRRQRRVAALRPATDVTTRRYRQGRGGPGRGSLCTGLLYEEAQLAAVTAQWQKVHAAAALYLARRSVVGFSLIVTVHNDGVEWHYSGSYACVTSVREQIERRRVRHVAQLQVSAVWRLKAWA